MELIKEILPVLDEMMNFLMLLIAVCAAVHTAKATKDREIKARQFTEKKKVYEEFVKIFVGVELERERRNNEVLEKVLSKERKDELDKISDLKSQLVIYASQEFIDEISCAMFPNRKMSINRDSILWASTERVFRAMRRDLGHADDDSDYKFYETIFKVPWTG